MLIASPVQLTFIADIMKNTLLTLISISWFGPLFGVFQKVDDFENYPTGQQPPTPWTIFQEEGNFLTRPTATVVADPFNAGQGKVLAINPGAPATSSTLNQNIELALPKAQHIAYPPTGSKLATMYFKVAVPLIGRVAGASNLTWGMVADEKRDPDTGLHGYGSYSALGRIEKDGIIDIRDGASYVDLSNKALQTRTYYEFWFIIDHFNSTFSQYIKGGADYANQTLLHENAEFRNATWDALETILFISSAGGTKEIKGTDDLFIDDIYIDVDGKNLASPNADEGTGDT